MPPILSGGLYEHIMVISLRHTPLLGILLLASPFLAAQDGGKSYKISQYIRKQHSPPALLYRLLIRPWLKKEHT